MSSSSAAALSLTDAVRSTLRRHPAIALSRTSLAAQTANVRAARAAFDPRVMAELGHDRSTQYLLPAERYAPAERTLAVDRTRATLGVSTGSRWGTRVDPSVTLERVVGRRDPNPLELPTGAVQRARVELALAQPLLRGRGVTGAASELRAAEYEQHASEHAAGHDAQAQVFATILAYYRFVAADEAARDLSESVARAQRLVQETEQLLRAEHSTRADLGQARASLELQSSQALAAEADRNLARFELAAAMGLPGSQVPEWSPTDPLLQPADEHVAAKAADGMVQHALLERRDLRALDESLAAAGALTAGAERNALPALDLGVTVGFVGALDRDGVGPFFETLGSNLSGVNAGATLTLELPWSNHAAFALSALRRAEQRAATIVRDDGARRIEREVRSAIDDVRISAAAFDAAARAVAVLEQLVRDEREKLAEGLSTLIDVVLTEERMTQARITRTASRLRYAEARARLAFEMAGLPESELALPARADALLALPTTLGAVR